MKEALVPGYQNFKAIDCDGDIGWSLFSYDLPPAFDAATTIPFLHGQIDGTAPSFAARPGGMASRWVVVKEDATELRLQYRTQTYGSEGYDEWRVHLDAGRRRVTAMYSNLDSPAERQSYPYLEQAFERAHSSK
jgi:hypothetical protein